MDNLFQDYKLTYQHGFARLLLVFSPDYMFSDPWFTAPPKLFKANTIIYLGTGWKYLNPIGIKIIPRIRAQFYYDVSNNSEWKGGSNG